MMYNPDVFSDYNGRKVQLWPSDTTKKFATIEHVDDLGWTFKITHVSNPAESSVKIGDKLFVPHSNSHLIFKMLDSETS